MKLIQQKDRSGCVIACLAMLSGKSYDAVRRLYLEHHPGRERRLNAVNKNAGVRGYEMRRLCELLKIDPLVVHATEPFAVTFRGKWGRHMVVFNEYGRMYDPSAMPRRKKRKHA